MDSEDDKIKEKVKTYGGFPSKGMEIAGWTAKKKCWRQQPIDDGVEEQYGGF